MFSYNPRHKSLDDIKKYVTELDILQNYFPDIRYLPITINSPLREDIHPSFSIFNIDDKILYKDFSTGESGDIYTLLSKIWGISFIDTLDKISKELNIEKKAINTTKTNNKNIRIKSNSKLLCKIRDWKDYDIKYWESYGVTLQWLKWAEVYPISHIIIDKDNRRYVFKAAKLAYTFVERKEGNITHKIYQPLEDRKRKWYSKHDKSVVSLWTKIPLYGDKVVICSSLKDALALSCNTGIPALAVQGEAYGMSNTAINELKRRYKKQYILLDNDEYGIKDAIKLSERTGFKNIVLPQFKGGKDISDYFKIFGKEKFIQLIKNLFKDE